MLDLNILGGDFRDEPGADPDVVEEAAVTRAVRPRALSQPHSRPHPDLPRMSSRTGSHPAPTSKEGRIRGDGDRVSSPSPSPRNHQALRSPRKGFPSSLSSKRDTRLGEALSRSESHDHPLVSPPVLGKRKTRGDATPSPKRKVRFQIPDSANDDSLQPNPAPSPTTSRLRHVYHTLYVSGTILGHGSCGTFVMKGYHDGRTVAVKRVHKYFVTIVKREVMALHEAEHHPNVIRYHYYTADEEYYYIALDLCPATLVDIIERPNNFADIVAAFEPKNALRQITSGLRYLHSLQIIHRDIKPQNILVSPAGQGGHVGHRMLISDFGMCKKLEAGETSYEPSGTRAGTTGWRAPEVLQLESETALEAISPKGRLRKSVDIFSLGCLSHYVLTNGRHPFGQHHCRRDSNILDDVKDLRYLLPLKEGIEAEDLIRRMLSPEARERPDTETCLLHPYFWTPERRLNFLQEASDWFDQCRRTPGDTNVMELERGARDVVGADWTRKLDPWFIAELGKRRTYNGTSVAGLIRVIRNKRHHYYDFSEAAKCQIGSMPEGFLSYFTDRFPRLILHTHSVILKLSLTKETMLSPFFKLAD